MGQTVWVQVQEGLSSGVKVKKAWIVSNPPMWIKISGEPRWVEIRNEESLFAEEGEATSTRNMMRCVSSQSTRPPQEIFNNMPISLMEKIVASNEEVGRRTLEKQAELTRKEEREKQQRKERMSEEGKAMEEEAKKKVEEGKKEREEVDEKWEVSRGETKVGEVIRRWKKAEDVTEKLMSEWSGHRTAFIRAMREGGQERPKSTTLEKAIMHAFGFDEEGNLRELTAEQRRKDMAMKKFSEEKRFKRAEEVWRGVLELMVGLSPQALTVQEMRRITVTIACAFVPPLEERDMEKLIRTAATIVGEEEEKQERSKESGEEERREKEKEEKERHDTSKKPKSTEEIIEKPETWNEAVKRGEVDTKELSEQLRNFVWKNAIQKPRNEDRERRKNAQKEVERTIEVISALLKEDRRADEKIEEALVILWKNLVLRKVQLENEWEHAIQFAIGVEEKRMEIRDFKETMEMIKHKKKEVKEGEEGAATEGRQKERENRKEGKGKTIEEDTTEGKEQAKEGNEEGEKKKRKRTKKKKEGLEGKGRKVEIDREKEGEGEHRNEGDKEGGGGERNQQEKKEERSERRAEEGKEREKKERSAEWREKTEWELRERQMKKAEEEETEKRRNEETATLRRTLEKRAGEEREGKETEERREREHEHTCKKEEEWRWKGEMEWRGEREMKEQERERENEREARWKEEERMQEWRVKEEYTRSENENQEKRRFERDRRNWEWQGKQREEEERMQGERKRKERGERQETDGDQGKRRGGGGWGGGEEVQQESEAKRKRGEEEEEMRKKEREMEKQKREEEKGETEKKEKRMMREEEEGKKGGEPRERKTPGEERREKGREVEEEAKEGVRERSDIVRIGIEELPFKLPERMVKPIGILKIGNPDREGRSYLDIDGCKYSPVSEDKSQWPLEGRHAKKGLKSEFPEVWAYGEVAVSATFEGQTYVFHFAFNNREEQEIMDNIKKPNPKLKIEFWPCRNMHNLRIENTSGAPTLKRVLRDTARLLKETFGAKTIWHVGGEEGVLINRCAEEGMELEDKDDEDGRVPINIEECKALSTFCRLHGEITEQIRERYGHTHIHCSLVEVAAEHLKRPPMKFLGNTKGKRLEETL